MSQIMNQNENFSEVYEDFSKTVVDTLLSNPKKYPNLNGMINHANKLCEENHSVSDIVGAMMSHVNNEMMDEICKDSEIFDKTRNFMTSLKVERITPSVEKEVHKSVEQPPQPLSESTQTLNNHVSYGSYSPVNDCMVPQWNPGHSNDCHPQDRDALWSTYDSSCDYYDMY